MDISEKTMIDAKCAALQAAVLRAEQDEETRSVEEIREEYLKWILKKVSAEPVIPK